MRYYDIALFIFLFNIALGFLYVTLHDTGITNVGVGAAEGFTKTDIGEGEAEIAEQVSDVYTPIWSELNWLVENVRLVVQGAATFITTLSKATILFPLLWNELAAPFGVGTSAIWISFVALMSAGIYFIYFMAILQFVTGRSAKDIQ